MQKIDFLLLWVDGSDPEWKAEKDRYKPVKDDYSSVENRFREWDNLQYWFRGVEKYAPWVNKIFFVTWGHRPKWLNKNHPKLKIINHKDFIRGGYLPTFNSNCIELNLHNIPELSEHFVLFNDDVFLLDMVKPEDFFLYGKPRDAMYFNAIVPAGEKAKIAYTNLNNTRIINTYFNKNDVMRHEWKKIFRLDYGSNLIRTFLLMPWNRFVGFGNPHIAQAHLKSTFSLVWEKEYDNLHATCMNKFRGLNDCSHWLMRYWNLCSGNFLPRGTNFGKYFNMSDNNTAVCDFISQKRGRMVCVNDMDASIDFEKAKRELKEAFEVNLGEKSSFES